MTSPHPRKIIRALGAGVLALGLALAGTAPASALLVPTGGGHGHGHGNHKVINYVNLGDSYSAGFGSGGLREGPIPDCVQGDGPNHVTKLDAKKQIKLTVNAACAGLTAEQVGQVAALFTKQLKQAGLVTMTLGGNDLDLRELVAACSAYGTNQACDALVLENTRRLPAVSKAVHQTLRQVDKATRGQIIVLGYPRIFTLTSAGNPFISQRNAWKLNKLADGLDRAIRRGTYGTSAEFASVTQRFRNHGFGAANSWIYMNASDLTDPRNIHPTTTGYLKGYYPVVNSRVDRRVHHWR